MSKKNKIPHPSQPQQQLEETQQPYYTLSAEDKALFENAMQAVKPLNPIMKHTKATKPFSRPDLIRRAHATAIGDRPAPNYCLSNYVDKTVEAETALTFCRPGLSKKHLSELKKGQYRIEARLDLHGLKPDDARDALCHFIENQQNSNSRCLLIIHGKGGRHGEAPVLKNLVNHWLTQFPGILAFYSALPKHGGTGAVYVLLNRRRTE